MKSRFLAIALVAIGVAAPAAHAQTWRSSLYPQHWAPGYKDPQGRFLHDFSYAGYRQGLRNIPGRPPGPMIDVVKQFGADPTGKTDSTQELQAAIDYVGGLGGGIVYLPPGVFRCDGQLTIKHSWVVLRGSRPNLTTLYFTKWQGINGKSHITFKGTLHEGANIKLNTLAKNAQHDVRVKSSAGLKVGDHVHVGWTITSAFVAEHGMTGIWKMFNGQWRPFFRRKIKKITKGPEGHVITLDVPLRYAAKTRDGASIRKVNGLIQRSGIEHISVSNAINWNNAWNVKNVHLIEIANATDCWVRNVKSRPSPSGLGGSLYHLMSGGVIVRDSKSVTIQDCTLGRSQNRGGSGNGYVIELMRSNEVLVKDTIAYNGRHNFIQNWDFGASGLVFVRCQSWGSRTYTSINDPTGTWAYSEYHHSLAMGCLVDQSWLDDGWLTGNRGTTSQGAGHTGTGSVFWNTTGAGMIHSYQYGNGYIIGTQGIATATAFGPKLSTGAAPEDYREGLGVGSHLYPPSLYEDQLFLRKGP